MPLPSQVTKDDTLKIMREAINSLITEVTAISSGGSVPAHTHSTEDIVSGVMAAARLPNATVSQPGIVQLVDNLSSTSQTLAPTANQVKILNDTKAPLSHTHDAAAIVSGTIAAARLPTSSTASAGIVQLIDSSTSTSLTLAPTAAALKAVRDMIPAGLTAASQAEAEAGVENTKYTTSLRVAQAIAAQRGWASQALAEAGADNATVMTPLRTAQAIASQRAFASNAEAQALSSLTKVMSPGTWYQSWGSVVKYGTTTLGTQLDSAQIGAIYIKHEA